VSTANEAIQRGDHYYGAPEQGKVTDNADPEGLYRVKVEVPGIIEETDWIFPIGSPGGGSKGRGGWVVPEVGAHVIIMFIGGDVQHPVYMCGWWGTDDGAGGGPEMPTEAQAVDVADANKIQTFFETKNLKVWVDEREGKEQFALQDKNDDTTFLQIDFTTGVLTISGSTAVVIKSDGAVSIEGSSVSILGRNVLPNGKQIG
jgi:uncharacterized protein involved in type VI secretion and phage assembly